MKHLLFSVSSFLLMGCLVKVLTLSQIIQKAGKQVLPAWLIRLNVSSFYREFFRRARFRGVVLKNYLSI
jgi:hypothetical protein